MEALPTTQPQFAASCALDTHETRQQLERYRHVGEGATVLERSPRRLALRLRPDVDRDEVAEAVATERQCCPFYAIDWNPDSRELSFGVDHEHEPALGAIAEGFGLSR